MNIISFCGLSLGPQCVDGKLVKALHLGNFTYCNDEPMDGEEKAVLLCHLSETHLFTAIPHNHQLPQASIMPHHIGNRANTVYFNKPWCSKPNNKHTRPLPPHSAIPYDHVNNNERTFITRNHTKNLHKKIMHLQQMKLNTNNYKPLLVQVFVRYPNTRSSLKTRNNTIQFLSVTKYNSKISYTYKMMAVFT